MKLIDCTLTPVLVVLLAGCAATDTKPPTPDTRPAPPVVPTEPPPSPPPPPPPPETKPAVNSKELSEEAQRLSGMQKAYFTVFKIDEAGTGLTPRQNANGVYDLQKQPRGERLRVIVTQQPKKPAKLAVGTYNVTLDTVFDYLETQSCKSGSCAGKQQKMVRSISKLLRIQISPQNQYYGGQDVSLATAGTPGNYRSTYSNVVLTVKRITVTPVPAAPATASSAPARQD